jgi:acyl-CoA synthetase (AMP-forming)/AMP-acid ligase II
VFVGDFHDLEATMASMSEPTNACAESKLLINIIEEKARRMPDNTFMRYPGIDWETQGYKSISWIQWARAIDKVAYWLDTRLGSLEESQTFAYFGPNDARYAILIPASIKTGRKVSQDGFC